MNIDAGTLPLVRDRYDIIGRVGDRQSRHSIVRERNIRDCIHGKEEG